ncbi:MAG: hypothetical protein H6867_04060 [Rhodospirillales bacterium]|nr:hypothetical protein [Rhodospirillales bacterium]MCB9996325.1 hypothetical protein [Rhodospirillales bacterium]
MKTLKFFTILSLAVMILSYSSVSYAESKPWVWGWWESHWDGLDFIPYQNGKHPHNSQWDHSKWEPQHWESQKGSGMKMVDGFYKADILRGQYVDDDIPVLEVGPAFYMLGGQEQRRVVSMVDYVFDMTGRKENGMFHLYDWKTKEPIGAYTKYGLQLQ